MSWLIPILLWYGITLILGMMVWPITKKLFGNFIDQGYAFSRTIGILLLSYLTFVFGVFKIIPFTQTALIIMMVFILAISYRFLFTKTALDKKQRFNLLILILIEEIMFFVSLLLLALIRSQEPSIRSLEKFMDFGFMNSILRSRFFPPLDMWLSADSTRPAGYNINYYYFGHLTGALLIKLSGIKASIGYNLMLATIFAQGLTLSFSLVVNIINTFHRQVFKNISLSIKQLFLYGIIGSYIVNFGGNLHTIYLFTKGYPNENPVPFWEIFSKYNPLKYWYPNATRFIPYTIHEFPVYSYVVADLHGHVFDIPFVLLTLALLFLFFTKIVNAKYLILNSVLLGFMAAIHYMTNAFDGPIYLLLAFSCLLLLYRFQLKFFIGLGITVVSFLIFSLPFSLYFEPFVSGIGVNCSPTFLTNIGKIGPFLFEKGNCQITPPWMLFVLWGFFWISLLLFAVSYYIHYRKHTSTTYISLRIVIFVLLLFIFGIGLTIIPEFFYIKDIYPAHFRANTMFKLGYQAFMMMGIASAFTFYIINTLRLIPKIILKFFYTFFLFFILIYPFYAFPSYYGQFDRKIDLDGASWLTSTRPEDKEIVDYLNNKVTGQPVVLEAQGDSYTDFERISAHTGLPTVAGWWVHEWLWRGSAEIVGKRIPDIAQIYESNDENQTRQLLRKYRVVYVVVAGLEKEKYPKLNEKKFTTIGKLILKTHDGFGALYQVYLTSP